MTDSTLEIELSSDAKSIDDDDDDDSAIGEGISESQPVSSARPQPPPLPPKPVEKPVESTPASLRFNGMRSGFFPETESLVRRIPVPGSSTSAAPIPGSAAAPTGPVLSNMPSPTVTRPPRGEEFKAMALHLSEVADSDDSERQSTSRDAVDAVDAVDQQQLRQQQEQREELERQKQEKVKLI